MKISLVINCDTRNQNDQFTGVNLGGCVNEDFLYAGVENKIKFFDGFDKEVILYIDEHERLSDFNIHINEYDIDTLVIRKHTNEPSFNDWNYIRALSMATGDIIVHVDQDTAMFAKDKEEVARLLDMAFQYNFISYPSWWSPKPVHDDSFDHTWVSTRFFMCERESLDLAEIAKCQKDYDYWCATYPVARRCHWFEHLAGSIAKYRNQSVFYPPIELDKYAIFSWRSYKKGTLQMLNNMPYEEVRKWIEERGIHYPNDLNA